MVKGNKREGGDKPFLFAPSKWVSQDDSEWAEDIGIFIYPKGMTPEEGTMILSPKLLRELNANLPANKTMTAQGASMGILSSIISIFPNLGSKDLVRAYAIVSAHVGMQYFPRLKRPFGPER
jgi:hypothetical protein